MNNLLHSVIFPPSDKNGIITNVVRNSLKNEDFVLKNDTRAFKSELLKLEKIVNSELLQTNSKKLENSNSQYKPLLFSTSMRNPNRIRDFLIILYEYNDRKLSVKLTKEIAQKLIKKGLYRPTVINKYFNKKINDSVELSKDDLNLIMRTSKQNHQTTGFPRGWPSRFDSWFKLSKELGFVYYKLNGKIIFTDSGKKLIESGKTENVDKNTSLVFLNALVKYQRNNPFRKVRNSNIPLILLLEVINLINANRKFKQNGISKYELLLLIYWKNNNADELYQRIVQLRKDYNFKISINTVLKICQIEIMEGTDRKRSVKSANDYIDDFIRKMRITGLFSLRDGGKYLDINQNEKTLIKYILKNYSNIKNFTSEGHYFNYVSELDPKLKLKAPKVRSVSKIDKTNSLLKWLNNYDWQTIKHELNNLICNKDSTDPILKYIKRPVRLEFLSALALKSKYPELKVVPNYPIDDEGLPTSTASGFNDQGDIECFLNVTDILVEVTLRKNKSQLREEVLSIFRHLNKLKNNNTNSICFFIAPVIIEDSSRMITFIKDKEDLDVYPLTISEFIDKLEDKSLFANIK